MKNQFIIPSIIIAASILGGFWMVKPPSKLKPPSEIQKVIVVQPPKISIAEAVHNEDIGAIKRHIAAGTDINEYNGATPLILAIVNRSQKVVEALIAGGADVNARNEGGAAALHWAVHYKKVFAELLIAEGADVNAMSNKGQTPLDWAINSKVTEIADLLRKHGGKTGEELKAEGK